MSSQFTHTCRFCSHAKASRRDHTFLYHLKTPWQDMDPGFKIFNTKDLYASMSISMVTNSSSSRASPDCCDRPTQCPSRNWTMVELCGIWSFQVCFNCEIGLNSPPKSVGLGPCSLTSKSVHFGMHLDYTFRIIRHHEISWSMTSLSPSVVDLLWGKDRSLEALSFRHRLHGSLVLPCEQQRARWTFWR